ncbi:MAG: hypothetical protein JWM45_1066 [Pseudonocardiales bacterium]|nr:hypothetical protein [Pseudonocardiales bacterium]
MASCLDQWRHAIVACDDVRLPDQVRDIESVSRMVYSVMLDTVAELESRAIAATAGFRDQTTPRRHVEPFTYRGRRSRRPRQPTRRPPRGDQ